MTNVAAERTRLHRQLSEATLNLTDARRLAVKVIDDPRLDHQVRDYVARLELEIDWLRRKIENLAEG
jgi:hypothetical protein